MSAIQSSKAELCVALDFRSLEEAEIWTDRLAPFNVIYKFGLRLLPHLPASFLEKQKKRGKKIFIDAKLHDIPSQVADAVKSWTDLGADYLTIHLSGPRMIEAALQARSGTEILGVSVLTSMEQKDFTVEGDLRPLAEIVSSRVAMAYGLGLRYVVSSAFEVPALLRSFPDLQCVNPGLFIDASEVAGDQSRVMHYEDALKNGSKMLVIGRSILNAQSPEVLVESILKRIS